MDAQTDLALRVIKNWLDDNRVDAVTIDRQLLRDIRRVCAVSPHQWRVRVVEQIDSALGDNDE